VHADLIPVTIHGGLVVMHTAEEYERLWRGVDRDACHAMVACIDTWVAEEAGDANP
jgi:hypothetical protein